MCPLFRVSFKVPLKIPIHVTLLMVPVSFKRQLPACGRLHLKMPERVPFAPHLLSCIHWKQCHYRQSTQSMRPTSPTVVCTAKSIITYIIGEWESANLHTVVATVRFSLSTAEERKTRLSRRRGAARQSSQVAASRFKSSRGALSCNCTGTACSITLNRGTNYTYYNAPCCSCSPTDVHMHIRSWIAPARQKHLAFI